MLEILKVKLNDTQTLIAYDDATSELVQRGGTRTRDTHREVAFKVGPTTGGHFVDCQPEAARVLLLMLDRQEKPSP